MRRLFENISRKKNVSLALEHAVYGSFAFREGGYDVLACSKGCKDNWKSSLKLACEKYGEPTREAHGPAGVFSLRIDRETRMIVGPSDQGIDDQGRPRALAFHVLFISKDDEKRIDFDPFALAPFLKRSWSSDTPSELPKLTIVIAEPPTLPLDDRARSIVRSLRKGKRVSIGAKGPIDNEARAVWRALPKRLRRAKSFATWAYSLANRFDLVALPESSTELFESDAEYVGPFAEHADGEPPVRMRPIGLFLATLVLLAAAIAHWRGFAAKKLENSQPARSAYFEGEVVGVEDRENIASALYNFAADTEVFDSKKDKIDETDPTAWMILISDRLRYRGAFLTESELRQSDQLFGDLGTNGRPSLIREWDRRLRFFVPDRPLPADFKREDASLRWRIAVFAWSFHLDPRLAEGNPKETLPAILAELARPETSRASFETWKREFPALREQEKFLERLPLP